MSNRGAAHPDSSPADVPSGRRRPIQPLRRVRDGSALRLVAINTGSASVKLDAVAYDGRRLQPLHAARYESSRCDPDAVLQDFLSLIDRPEALVHRVVHGGDELVASRLVDGATETAVEALAPLAPLHNPVALRWIRAARALIDVPQVAVFDTAFYGGMPAVAKHYALPQPLAAASQLHRYGFHGIAHRAMWQRWRDLRPDLPGGGRVITIQLGGGSSITAIRDGVPADTSMGFSPSEGLMMATRCGDIDPGAVLHLLKLNGATPAAAQDDRPADAVEAAVARVARLLNAESGLLGVSGKSADMRDLIDDDGASSRFAVELYCYRLRKYIGAYLAALGGAEGIVFGGGIGEHAPRVRSEALAGLHWCGVHLNVEANRRAVGGEARISDDDSPIDVHVVPVDETRILAAEAYALVRRRGAAPTDSGHAGSRPLL